MGATDRTYVSGRFALDLNGGFAGFLKSCEGGDIKANVISEPAGLDNRVHKHIGQPEYGDIKLQLGLSSSPAINDWIRESWNKNYQRKAGAVIACDFNYKEKGRRTFTEALITEVGFPALDGSAKEPAYMTVGLSPEKAFYVKCDAETNPPEVVDAGQLIVEIGMAPVKPAEFVIFRIGQMPSGGGVDE